MKRIVALAIVCIAAQFALAQEGRPVRPVVQNKPIQSKVLADLGKAEAIAAVKSEHPLVKVAPAGDAKGVQISLPRQEAFPSAMLWQAKEADGDWSAFDYLRLNVLNTGKARTTVFIYLYDSVADDAKRGEFGFGVDPGQTQQIAVPLGLLYRADKSDTLDLKKMSKLRLAIERQQVPAEIVIDALALVRVFEGPDPFFFFDFKAAESPAMPQTLPVTPATVYKKERGYGLLSPEGLAVANPGAGRFPIYGDGLNGKKASFGVDVPNGKYEVQAIAYGAGWDNVRCLNYSIEAEGEKVLDVPLTLARFYSNEGLYWGTELFHNPSKSMWEQYGREFFKPFTFKVEVTDGQLNLDFHDCAVFAAWVYPVAAADKGRARVEALQDEQAWRVQTSVARVIPSPDAPKNLSAEDAAAAPAPNAVDLGRGFRVYGRHYTLMVYPDRMFQAKDLLTKLEVSATPGEYEPATFTVRPMRDLGKAIVSVSDLKGPGTIPASEIKLDVVKYFPVKSGGIDYVLTPSYLFPVGRAKSLPDSLVDLYGGFNRQFWLTVHVPEKAAPGMYCGTVSVSVRTGSVEIPLEVTVYPYALPESPKKHGFFNAGAPGYQVTRLFPADKQDALNREVIGNELTDMIAHGAEGNTLPNAELISVDKDGGNLKLEFKAATLYAEMIKKHGLTKVDHITSAFYVMSAMERRFGIKELSPEFNKAFVEAVRQTAEFWKQQGIPVIIQVIDEPREVDLEDWNRNRATTVQLCRLAKQAGNARTYVTPMGDTDGFGNHYTVMMPLMDVWMTHCWPGSQRGIYLAGKEKIAELWFYNNGLDRFQWGYHLWKSDAKGDYEWVYAWEPRGAKPLIDEVIGINDYVVPYAKSVLPKLSYEWAREGVDDMRYLARLEQILAQPLEKQPTPETAKTVAEAKEFLGLLRRTIPDYPETDLITGAEAGAKYTEGGLKNFFDPWRKQVAEYIIAIQSGKPAARVEEAWAPLPKKASEKTKTAVCLLVDKAPTTDGKFDDEVWKDAPVHTNFISLATLEDAMVKTEVRIVSDGKKIYFAFHCVEPKYGELKAYATERDNDVWKDDEVEVFLDTQHNKKNYFQVIVNTLGTIQDADTSDVSWDGDIQTAVRKGKGFYDVEIAIGLESMKAKVGPDVTWGLNLCRGRAVAPAENSSWTHVGHSFHQPEKFGTLTFRKAGTRD